MPLTLKNVKEKTSFRAIKQGLFLSILSQKVEYNSEYAPKQQKSDYFRIINHHQNCTP